jgi:glutathione S-transferase
MTSKSNDESHFKKKCIFFDVKHSNNAARVRLWLRLHGSLLDHVETVLLTHDDLEDGGKLAEINPLRKVPAFITNTGMNLFESFVILSYLEDRFGDQADGPKLVLDTPDDRAFVQLLVRIHDVYISSPNCTQPHFSHTQGCMYLDPVPTKYTPARRTMPDPNVRCLKLREIYERLTWLESTIRLPFMASDRITHADITWFPTCVFMEVLLPYVFDWSQIFHEHEKFPRLTQWYGTCCANEHFASVRDDIYGVLMKQKEDGRFDNVREVARSHPNLQWKFM